VPGTGRGTEGSNVISVLRGPTRTVWVPSYHAPVAAADCHQSPDKKNVMKEPHIFIEFGGTGQKHCTRDGNLTPANYREVHVVL